MFMVLIRHGSIEPPTFMLEPSLNKAGRNQIREVAKKLHQGAWEMIVTSPLARAIESAEILQRELGIPLLVEDFLRERVHGPLAGRMIMPCASYANFLTKIPDREGVGLFIQRVVKGFERLTTFYADHKVIVVTHGGVIKVFHGAIIREHVKRIAHASAFFCELGFNTTGRLSASRIECSFSEEDGDGSS